MFVYVFLVAVTLLVSERSFAAPESIDVKAVFLFRFFDYVSVQDGVIKNTICVYGRNPFGDTLMRLSQKYADRKVYEVLLLDRLDESSECGLLFLSEVNEEIGRYASNMKSVITVGDSLDFARDYGIIELQEIKNKIHLNINRKRANENGVVISSRLLKISEVVE